jgi:hypothetical protein
LDLYTVALRNDSGRHKYCFNAGRGGVFGMRRWCISMRTPNSFIHPVLGSGYSCRSSGKSVPDSAGLYNPSLVHNWSLCYWSVMNSGTVTRTHPRRLNQPFLRGRGEGQTSSSFQRTDRREVSTFSGSGALSVVIARVRERDSCGRMMNPTTSFELSTRLMSS